MTEGVSLRFDTAFDAQPGTPVVVAPALIRVTAPNPGPFTFTGTNTYLLGQQRLAILDPGPDDPRHLGALLQVIAGRPLDAILLTHTHNDHSALARRLQQATGAPILFGGRHRTSRPLSPGEGNPLESAADSELIPDRVLADGELIAVGETSLLVIATPGHCANHLAYAIPDTDMLLSGDHVMGWNSTLVSPPDGSMRDYMASLRKLIGMPFDLYLPGHGGPIAQARAFAEALLAHREARIAQVSAALAAGASSIEAIVAAIYPSLTGSLRDAAALTVQAQLEYLAEIRREAG